VTDAAVPSNNVSEAFKEIEEKNRVVARKLAKVAGGVKWRKNGSFEVLDEDTGCVHLVTVQLVPKKPETSEW
jgi:hypothetical protein